eukprot:GILI01010028.1.p1 GENE.GILI01010028.1~~GILI01010028.1.p1  ORF type:complete len:260 (+),score=15.11 GILI01010028.1:75-782(+)
MLLSSEDSFAKVAQEPVDDLSELFFHWDAYKHPALEDKFIELLPRLSSLWKVSLTPYSGAYERNERFDPDAHSELVVPILNKCLVACSRKSSLEHITVTLRSNNLNWIDTATWLELSNLKNLKSFTLKCFVGESFLQSLTTAFPALEGLTIGLRAERPGEYGVFLRHLVNHLPNLQKLEVCLHAQPITEEELSVVYDSSLILLCFKGILNSVGKTVSEAFYTELRRSFAGMHLST